MSEIKFRYARKQDIPLVLNFIRELAEYEGVSDKVAVTEEVLLEWIVIRNKAEVLFEVLDGVEIGFCLFFHNFSTFMGKAGIYIEDLYVKPEYRGKGYGKELFKKIGSIAIDRECHKLELSCPDWNKSSIEFYKHMGALPMEDWTMYRLVADDLLKLNNK